MKRFSRPSVGLGIAAVALMVMGGAAGYLASIAITSPAEQIARAQPPRLTQLTEPVTLSKVSQTVTYDATVEPGTSLSVSAPTPPSGATSVVTRMPIKTGQIVRGGDLIAEVSGRPIIALKGAIPSYRPLAPGSTGTDVKQLQAALLQLHYYGGRLDGVYGASTAAAVSVLYRHLGYAPTIVGADQLQSANDALAQAQRTVDGLKGAKGSSPERRDAEASLATALSQLRTAKASSGAEVPIGEIAFVASLPARVSETEASVGATSSGPLVTLIAGSPVVRGGPSPVDAARIKVGDSVKILLTPMGEATGTVVRTVAAPPPGDQSDGGAGTPQNPVFDVVPSQPLRRVPSGTPARVVVDVSSSKAVGLTVPVSAIYMDASGVDSVLVRRANGHTDRVQVATGFSGSGLVQVSPLSANALAPGDQVVIGRKQ